MSRLIDADALIEAVKDFPYGYRGMIVCTIAEQPTIEPEDRCSECDAWNKYKNYSQPERKKGRWIPVTNGRGGSECNLCHAYAPTYQSGAEYNSPYCPNCGALMER